MTRLQATVLLLRSLLDYAWPEPETATGKLLRRSLVVRALAPSERLECPECGGQGVVGKRKCRHAGCEGRGWYWVDPMDKERRPLGTEETGVTRSLTQRELGQLLKRLEDDPVRDAEDCMLRTLERRVQGGSYDALGRALEELRLRDLYGWRLALSVYVEAAEDPLRLSDGDVIRLVRAVCFLTERMPEAIRVPQEVVALGERDEMKARKANGASLGKIAKEYGCDRRKVRRRLAA